MFFDVIFASLSVNLILKIIKTAMLLNILFTCFSVFGFKSDQIPAFSFPNDSSVFVRYKQLLVDIREMNISPVEAERRFKVLASTLREAYPNTLDNDQISSFVFPLTRSNYSAVGGSGTGFYVRKFNLFDQKVSGSHPAHDIFIYDPDQDCVDNRKKDFVDIVSVGHGVVLAVEQNWADTSAYKGGNYVWVFDVERGGFWYYAHHRKVVVEAGQIVRPGDKLGEVGRTGFNAKSKRSDTHLHLMYLDLDDDFYPTPKNYYEWLKNAETIDFAGKAEVRKTKFPKIARLSPRNTIKYLPVRSFQLALKKQPTAKI